MIQNSEDFFDVVATDLSVESFLHVLNFKKIYVQELQNCTTLISEFRFHLLMDHRRQNEL